MIDENSKRAEQSRTDSEGNSSSTAEKPQKPISQVNNWPSVDEVGGKETMKCLTPPGEKRLID